MNTQKLITNLIWAGIFSVAVWGLMPQERIDQITGKTKREAERRRRGTEEIMEVKRLNKLFQDSINAANATTVYYEPFEPIEPFRRIEPAQPAYEPEPIFDFKNGSVVGLDGNTVRYSTTRIGSYSSTTFY